MSRVVAPSGETQVTISAGNDQRPSVAVLEDGGWIVTWVALTPDGLNSEIYQQRYDANGQALEQAVMVNRRAAGFQGNPAVAALPDGGWVVTWESDTVDGNGYDVCQRRYDASGQEIGPERIVNSVAAGGQQDPSIAVLADGGWVIAWRGDDENGDWDVFQTRFDANGYEVSSTVGRVNTHTGDVQFNPDVTALGDGGWVVTWTSSPQDGSGGGIYQQRYNASGVAVHGEVRVNTIASGEQIQPSVAALADGGWVVTWSSRAQDGSGYNIHQQRYHSSGWTLGRETVVNVAGANEQIMSDVKALPDGGWLVTWESVGQDGSEEGIFQRRYSATGQPVTQGDIQVNTTTTGAQKMASVSMLPDGGWIVTWQSHSSTGAPGEIYQQRFTAAGEKVGPTTPTALDLVPQAVAEGSASTASAGSLSVGAYVPDHAFAYRLVDDAGGRFRIEGDQIKVKDGARLDYEQATSHQVTVEVRDAAGATLTRTFTIAVTDVASENLAGGAASDVLKGGSFNDVFSGAGGDDTIYGGFGHDSLRGDAGRDVFVFDTKPSQSANRDKIADFTVRDDSLWLDNAVFTKLGTRGTDASPAQLKSGHFVKGSAAKDKNDHVIYDAKKGVLLYDADGSGKGKAVEIATLAKHLAVTHKDFFVI
ncbi:hypothetical protein [Microvirga arsenatis]|uniref:Cadherin domain-containing protein n=1 Tax=Microvirga arsenatis TaxID=2692265 RepID=A0ABW9YSI7_9HYPH|nr:hypothetical protein [Microvirga arsenatis]NBJ23054.1 hypothetical protein [Microvirga arsenatis]